MTEPVVTDELVNAWSAAYRATLVAHAPIDTQGKATSAYYAAERAGLAAALEHFLRERVEAVSVPDDGVGPWVHDRAAAGIAARALREAAAVLLDDERYEPTGHDDLCSYGPPGECDCCRGAHYRWLIGRADELERGGDR